MKARRRASKRLEIPALLRRPVEPELDAEDQLVKDVEDIVISTCDLLAEKSSD